MPSPYLADLTLRTPQQAAHDAAQKAQGRLEGTRMTITPLDIEGLDRLTSAAMVTSDDAAVSIRADVLRQLLSAAKDGMRMREALEWYAEKATAVHLYMTASPPATTAITVVMNELSLDDGKRAARVFQSPGSGKGEA